MIICGSLLLFGLKRCGYMYIIFIGLCVVFTYLLLLPYFPANNDYHIPHLTDRRRSFFIAINVHQNFLSSEFQREVPLFQQIHGLPYNTVQGWRKQASMPKHRLVTFGQAHGQTQAQLVLRQRSVAREKVVLQWAASGLQSATAKGRHSEERDSMGRLKMRDLMPKYNGILGLIL